MWTRALSALPRPIQGGLRLAYVATRVTADYRSLRTYLRLARADGAEVFPPEVALRIRALRGSEIWVRPRTSDLDTVWGTFARRYHLPPSVLGAPRTIWDLGSNIGLTMAHFASLFPDAQVLGVELDQENAALARRNTARWTDRCEVIHAAVWPTDGEAYYRRWPGGGTSNYRATESPEGTRVQAVSLPTLIRERGGPVDYLKMDVEGAERELLRDGTGWAQEVRCLKVELHGEYSVADCEHDLRRMGYAARRDPDHWACVTGLRR